LKIQETVRKMCIIPSNNPYIMLYDMHKNKPALESQNINGEKC